MSTIFADDGNEEYCGACRREGVLLCCENCPAAYHFGCAGYGGEEDVPGGEEDAWLCWGCSQKTKTPFLHSTRPLEKAVGKDVRVASKEGSIEYYRASVVGGNAAAVDVVYEDLPGVRESIDRSSRRLWHGTLNNDGWERRGSKYVPISRAYAIDINRTSGSPPGKLPGKAEARSTAAAAAAWQQREPAASGRSHAASKGAQAQDRKKAAPKPVAKKTGSFLTIRNAQASFKHEITVFYLMQGLGGPRLSAGQQKYPAAPGITGRAEPLPLPSKRPAPAAESAVSKRPRSSAPPTQGIPPVAAPPPATTAAPPARPPLSQTPLPALLASSQPRTAPAAGAGPPQPPTTAALPARPPLSKAPPPPTAAPSARPPPLSAPPPPLAVLQLSRAPGAARASPAVSVQSQSVPGTSLPSSASAPDVQQPLTAVGAGGNAPHQWPTSQAIAQPLAPPPPLPPALLTPDAAAALCSRLGTDQSAEPPGTAVDMDVNDMRRPFPDPLSLAALADASEWESGIAFGGSPESQGDIVEEMRTEEGSAAEDAPTPNPAATPEISGAGAFLDDDVGETAFTAALESWLESQKRTMYEPRIQQKPLSAYTLWKLVAKGGGSKMVTNNKGWARIARAVGAPESMTDKSTVTKRVFQLSLGDFEEATECGETDLGRPRARAATRTPPPRGRQRNRAGRSSPTRKRQRASGRAAERRVVGWVQVNKELALDVGAAVEVRSHDKQHTGGWLQARILQVCPGSIYEGGLRFEVELENISGSPGQKSQQAEPPVFGSGAQDASEKGSEGGGKGEEAAGRELAWVPLVHAPANTDYPAVLIRQPLQPAAPPTPAVDWRVGERVEGYWAEGGSWWPATLEQILPTGDELELRVDPTATNRDGELWVLPADHVRRGHSTEREGFGLLEPLQEEQWTTVGDLRRKLAWQQHTVDGWSIEAYATQAGMPQTSSEAAGAPPSRLHTTNRKRPAPDPLASLEEAAARVLGRTLSAATPRAESAAAGLLDLAPFGQRGGPFSSSRPGSPSVGSVSQIGGGSGGDEAFPDTASGDDNETGRAARRARADQRTMSRMALPPVVAAEELSCDEALDEGAGPGDGAHAKPGAAAEQFPGRWGKPRKLGGRGKPSGPPLPWECPVVCVPGSLDNFLTQVRPAAVRDPDYLAKREASAPPGGFHTHNAKRPGKMLPAAATAKPPAAGKPPAAAKPLAVLNPPAKGKPPAAGVNAPAKGTPPAKGAQRGSAPAKHDEAPAAAPAPAAAAAPESGKGQGSSRTPPSKQAAGTGQDSRPASAGPTGKEVAIRAPLQVAAGLAVMGRPIGLAKSLPGTALSGLLPAEQDNVILAHLKRCGAGQPAAAPVTTHALPYVLLPLPADTRATRRQPPPRPLPPQPQAAAARSQQAQRAGRYSGAPAASGALSRPPARVLGQFVSEPPSSTPGMYSQPALAMRSLLTSASEMLARGSAPDRPPPGLVSMPLGLLPPATAPLPNTFSSGDIQRAAEALAAYITPAGVTPLPSQPLRMHQPRAPYAAGLPGLRPSASGQQQQTTRPAAEAPSMESRYPRIMPLGPPPENARYPKIQFSFALPPPAFPAPSHVQPPHANGAAVARGGENDLQATPQETAGKPGLAGRLRQPPPGSSRLVAALSQSLGLSSELLPAAAAQLPPPQLMRATIEQSRLDANGSSGGR
ncbi:hypothetical protein COCSUDRAFT_48997 [Coccomyxa subellipsoidea C-169]|uniref:PHD-type domain-containing protein n=1 Tax=Coccomyxa subellipsoidea (strain C-169) TaxID=574566 RepID=I0YKZ6_COCSC|nr:hypothetical protein COCSUDRAFT_48997 [Coccomyxa subellipsoidea C-169]EIE19065.1 hypothetical protein COCSUDRAFT_48997 [Coccomyxa subellipsoidea C-169]|eukprot:XP_005643609.1 hypothetical protein COCSUDRAFT_48997 [Coccomyxa subellipsoidea C-169]